MAVQRAVAVSSQVMAMERDFGHEMDGVYTFTEGC